MEWNEQKAQEIIKKHKNRFSLRLTFKIVRVLITIFILYAIYMIVLSISYDFSKVGVRTEFYQKLAIDWTYPELTSDLSLDSPKEITPFLTQKIEIPLIRKIGKEDYVVSQLNLNKPILSAFTHIDIAESYLYDSDDQGFWFGLPYDPESGRKLAGDEDPGVWDTLDMIHEGNVADLAFSTEEYQSPKEILELVAPYDLTVLWMPLYMGEWEQFNEGGLSSGGDSMSLIQPWGLSGARLINEDYRGGSLVNGLDKGTIEESQVAMLDNMQTMLKENERLAERLLKTEHLQERYDYLNEKGFQAYGAIVTGPVKELLKLQELEGIHSVTLGKIKYWNWNE
ncbi:anti-sigma factor [Bacillus sp. FSL K6-3431]|uniref:anti-sigma factor n=1 Tax=Bacillus sp. FSL K6-3431 TaxID=2921500 RepID=UPI0030F9CD7D